MKQVDAKYTLWDLIRQLNKLNAESFPAFNRQNHNVALVTNVPSNLGILLDFNFNGDLTGQSDFNLLTSGSLEDFDLEKHDFSKSHFKLFYSKDPIVQDIESLYKSNLIYRVMGIENGVVDLTSIRSVYGESIVHHLISLDS